MKSNQFEKHPDSSKSGGINIEESDGSPSVAVEFIKQIGKKVKF